MSNQVLSTIQDDRRIESPEDEESQLDPIHSRCACQRRWDNPWWPSHHMPAEGVPLYKAALNGDLKEIQRILSGSDDRTILCSSLTEARETALHVAAGAEKAAIVRELVEQMRPKDLELQDSIGNTAFYMAVGTGNVKIATILMQKRKEVLLIRGANNMTPLYNAAVAGHPKMVRFVHEKFSEHIEHLDNVDELRDIFFAFIHASLFDLAIEMLSKVRQDLAWASNANNIEEALGILARKPPAFAGPTRLIDYLSYCCGLNTIPMQKEALELTNRLCKIISSGEQNFFDREGRHADELMFEAAKLGNDKFLSVLIGYYPDLIFRRGVHDGMSIFHIAVLHRHASIFKLFHNLGLRRDVMVRHVVNYPDPNNNDGIETIRYNMLHLAAKLPSSDRLSIVSGPALQMQRELLWFKEVERLSPPSERERRDSRDRLTPRELFTKEHKELRKDGEEWMRNTAESGMLVATLITTVVFTTASTLPGGNKEKDGSPVDLGKVMFHVFMVSDAAAMCSSIISAMMFLYILTSRYAEEDFLFQLPLKLVLGFTTLLFSMMALMVSFTAMFLLAYEKGNLISVGKSNLTWVPYLAGAMSILPIISLFVLVVNKLFVFRSTFGSKFLFRPNKSTFESRKLSSNIVN